MLSDTYPIDKYCTLNVFSQSFHWQRIKLVPLLANDVEVRQEWVASVAVVYRYWLSIPGPSLVSLPSTCVGVTSLINLNSQTAARQHRAPGTENVEMQKQKSPAGLFSWQSLLYLKQKSHGSFILLCVLNSSSGVYQKANLTRFGVFVLCSSGCLPGECWETGMVTSLHLHSFVPWRLL